MSDFPSEHTPELEQASSSRPDEPTEPSPSSVGMLGLLHDTYTRPTTKEKEESRKRREAYRSIEKWRLEYSVEDWHRDQQLETEEEERKRYHFTPPPSPPTSFKENAANTVSETGVASSTALPASSSEVYNLNASARLISVKPLITPPSIRRTREHSYSSPNVATRSRSGAGTVFYELDDHYHITSSQEHTPSSKRYHRPRLSSKGSAMKWQDALKMQSGRVRKSSRSGVRGSNRVASSKRSANTAAQSNARSKSGFKSKKAYG